MADSKDLILSRLLMQISDEYDKSVGSFFYDTQVPLAVEHETMYKQLDGILEQGFAMTAKCEYLDRKVAEQGMTRKPATFAEGTVVITGSAGAVINEGNKVSSDLAMYTVLETKTIPSSGNVTVAVQCDSEGAVGNVPVGAVKDFPISISGITSVTNTAPITGGYNAETDGELRERYFEKVSAPATSGNKQHYINWANEVSGVGDVRVKPLWSGNGTVKVIIINSNKEPAEPSLIQAVVSHIEDKRPIGASVTVVTANPVVINVSVVLTLEIGSTIATVHPGIEKAINEYLKKTAFVSASVSIAHIGSAILSVESVRDFTNLRLNNNTVNINITDEQVAVLGSVSLS